MLARLALLTLMLAFTAAPAQAAVVSVSHSIPIPNPKFPEPAYDSVVVNAAAGETNTLTVGDGPAGEIVVRDTTAPLTAGTDCSAKADGAVVCPIVRGGLVGFAGVVVSAGDGDDKVRAETFATVTGGPGADVLESTVRATLQGGEGDDTLTGGPGDDTLSGGPGADRLSAGATSPWTSPRAPPAGPASATRSRASSASSPARATTA